MDRVYNFSPGPSTLPEDVLKKAQQEMLNYGDTGMSVMELSHRSAAFTGIIEKAEKDLRDLMEIPDNYRVLFLQGGATLQFAMVPMNLMKKNGKAAYFLTGSFAKKAAAEAEKFGEVQIAGSSEDRNFAYIPGDYTIADDVDYAHITGNNTIYGTAWKNLPDTKGIPLVCDLSSSILSEKINVSDYGIIYAGAQKNLGPAGVTIVIIRDDLVDETAKAVPTLMEYKTMVAKNSLYNTPPTYSIYMVGLVLDWLKKKGGITAMEKINREKAAVLYDYLDNSDFYKAQADKDCRSLMNVTFTLPNDDLTKTFIKQAGEKGLVNLKGHRSVGGIRISIYNAMPVKGVETIRDFMKEFEKNNKE